MPTTPTMPITSTTGSVIRDETVRDNSRRHLTVMVLPVMDDCNLRCRYCFHHAAGSAGTRPRRDRQENLRELWKQAAEVDVDDITFLWHGGEPLLAGRSCFEDALHMQRTVLADKRVRNSIQTNATLVDEDWAVFLNTHDFGVSVSLDGPPQLHNMNRKYRTGEGSAEDALRGIRLLVDAGIEIGGIAVVSSTNVYAPDAVIEGVLDAGIRRFALSLTSDMPGCEVPLEPTVEDAEAFYAAAFDYWMTLDDPTVRIRQFVETVKALLGEAPRLCTNRPGGCGDFIAVDSSGDVYPCSRYGGNDDYVLGNIHSTPLSELLDGSRRHDYLVRAARLPSRCETCEILDFCFGGCAHHRQVCAQSSVDLACAVKRQTFRSARAALRREGLLE